MANKGLWVLHSL